MDIETKTARLDTLSVTIQALHVNGKQMTLSVFRQLPETEAIDEDSGLLFEDAEYWGTVNYDFKKNGKLWVVLSKEGKLYRAELSFCNFEKRYEEKKYMQELEKVIEMLKQSKAKRSPYVGSHRGTYFNFVSRDDVDQLPRYENMYLESKHLIVSLETIQNIANTSLGSLKKLPQLFIAV